MFLYAIAYHALGRKKESDAEFMELIAKCQAIDPYLIAEVYAFRTSSTKRSSGVRSYSCATTLRMAILQ